MNTSIREYKNEDIEIIIKMFNEVVEEGDAFLTEVPLTIAQMKYRIDKNNLITCVAITDGKISGAYMLRPNLKGRGNHIGNATYFVKNSFRSQGIGYLLGKHSLEKAKKIGFKALQFNSIVSTNEQSIKLWNKLDFQTIGVIPNGFRLPNSELVDILIKYKEL